MTTHTAHKLNSSTLTIKQDAFIKAYLLNGGNATQAAITAGYSARTAQVIGAENLTKPYIINTLKAHQQQQAHAFILSKTNKLLALERIIEAATTEHKEKGMVNMSAAIAAIKAHNEMTGDNAPTEISTSLKVTETLASKLTGGTKH